MDQSLFFNKKGRFSGQQKQRDTMKQVLKMLSLSVLGGLILTGCQSGGSGDMEVALEEGATTFSRGELYMYLSEKTQVNSDGGVFYSEYGTLQVLSGAESHEGTWSTHEGGVLCRHVDGQEDGPCETYYHNGDAVSKVFEGATTMAPMLKDGNTLVVREMFTKEETLAMISGKTVVWSGESWGTGAYYSPDGKLYTVWEGAPETGTWEVTDEGAVCWLVPSWGSGPCESYFMGPDGIMALYKGEASPASELRDGNVTDSL
jgi:hypothetical protein